MPVIGKDGAYYNNVDELMKANARWTQQEKQNQLLKEQNELIRQQQERERIQAELERERIARQKREENFGTKWETEIFPLMKEAGIKEPLEYAVKLRELYKSKPIEIPKIPMLKNFNEVNLMVYKNKNFSNFVNNVSKLAKPLQRLQTMCMVIPLILCMSLLLLSIPIVVEIGHDIIIMIIWLISCFGIIVATIKIYKKLLRNNPAFDKEKITKEINVLIEKQNKENRKEMQEWENKIKNYEQKRLQNFNFLLEIALEELGVAISELNQEKINFMLQFYKYPNEYEEKKKEYFNKQNTNKAKKDGTEIFLDL